MLKRRALIGLLAAALGTAATPAMGYSAAAVPKGQTATLIVHVYRVLHGDVRHPEPYRRVPLETLPLRIEKLGQFGPSIGKVLGTWTTKRTQAACCPRPLSNSLGRDNPPGERPGLWLAGSHGERGRDSRSDA